MKFITQVYSVVKTSLQSLGYRWRLAVSTVVGIALVVMVLLGFLSMSEGFRRTLENTGSAEIALIKSKGAKSETLSWLGASQEVLSRELAGIRKDGGVPMTSAEIYKAVNLTEENGSVTALGLRGMGKNGLNLRTSLSIVEGRSFAPGNRELLVGSLAMKRYPTLNLGQTVSLAGSDWTVVGVFDASDGLYGAELWTDADSVKDVFKTGPGFNVLRVALASGSTSETLLNEMTKDPRMADVDAVSEKEFFSSQSQGVIKIIELIGWPISILMAIGAIAGAINTMYNSVEAQKRDIATLRVLGFGPVPIFVSVMAEAIALVLIGGVIGTIFALLLFNGLEGTTTNSSQSQMTFKFAVSLGSILNAMTLAVIVGFFGGLIPALKAAKQPILMGLRE